LASSLAAALGSLPGHAGLLSLSDQAEILRGPPPARCDLPFATYASLAGLFVRLAAAPFLVAALSARVRALAPDVAVCAMPAALDLVMAAALRRAGVPFLVMIHDADAHPGDDFPQQMTLQRLLVHRSTGVIALSDHVAERLREQGLADRRPLLRIVHPPFVFGPPPPPPGAHGGPLRLLSFGRLLPYKGLDLLAAALGRLGARPAWEVRVVGSGPESAALASLRKLPGVAVENRWVPECEVGELLGWADAVVLSHTEASQSGVAAAAIAAGRWVVATRVGGIAEQLGGEPLAVLAEPTPSSLAGALAGLLAHPPPAPSPADAGAAWRSAAAMLVDDIAAAVPQLSAEAAARRSAPHSAPRP
jgi:glycosyltransferase involved in cell wall biosynthesis